MNNASLMKKVAGGGLPPLSANAFFHSLIKKADPDESVVDPVGAVIRQRPVTEEIVDDRPQEYVRSMAAVVAQQEARLQQAEAEASMAVQRGQELQQQAQQQIQQMQQQLQQLGQRAQMAEQGLQQAQSMQDQLGQQLTMLSQRSMAAGQEALNAKVEATQAHQERQGLEAALMNWKSQLQQIIDADPIQQKLQQEAAMQQQQMAQQQMMAQQGGQVPPEQQAQVQQAAQAQQAQQAQAQQKAAADRAFLLKAAFGIKAAAPKPKKRGPTPTRTASSPYGPIHQRFAAMGKHANIGSDIKKGLGLKDVAKDVARAFTQNTRGTTLVAAGAGTIGASLGALGMHAYLQRKKDEKKHRTEEVMRRRLKAEQITKRFRSPGAELKRKVPALRG